MLTFPGGLRLALGATTSGSDEGQSLLASFQTFSVLVGKVVTIPYPKEGPWLCEAHPSVPLRAASSMLLQQCRVIEEYISKHCLSHLPIGKLLAVSNSMANNTPTSLVSSGRGAFSEDQFDSRSS